MNMRTALPRHRGIALTFAATVCGISLLTGCNAEAGGTRGPGWVPVPVASGTATPGPVSMPDINTTAPEVPADKAFDPAKALAAAGETPYAANVKATTEVNGVPSATMSGRANLNGPFTGHVKMKSGKSTTEVVMTDDANYIRSTDAAEAAWTRTPRTDNGFLTRYEGYAKLILDAGPSARRGMEEQGGIATYRLSGYLSLAQIASVDPRTHTSMKTKGVTGFDIDQWIDSRGRTIRFEQRFELRGLKAANKVTFSDFGPAEKFTAPTSG
ncbi:hypothetical protein [Streptomyces sp. NPDC059593]|uniref:hypothetical protein n=1 Tax=Streptomyces sp. NPDC059593 TaxID=3346878 RepID=UPI0036C6C98D